MVITFKCSGEGFLKTVYLFLHAFLNQPFMFFLNNFIFPCSCITHSYFRNSAKHRRKRLDFTSSQRILYSPPSLSVSILKMLALFLCTYQIQKSGANKHKYNLLSVDCKTGYIEDKLPKCIITPCEQINFCYV